VIVVEKRQLPALALAALLASTAIAHAVAPGSFDTIVPHVLPGPARFWTLLSGATEAGLAIAIAWPPSRRIAAALAALFFVLVFPANVQMAVDWSARPGPEFALALLRLPLQIPLVAWAWWVAVSEPAR
jgi:uncharacterized membrane protein